MVIAKAAAVAAAFVLCAGMAEGQVPRVPDTDAVRVRIGPLLMNPTLSLTNAGVDDNVFNESESEGPQRDFTLTVTPGSEIWMRVGRTWIAATVAEDLVWYQDFASERSVNSRFSAGWIVPLSRVAFHVGGSWLKVRERPGFEIDARTDRQERGVNGSLEIRALPRTHFGVTGSRRQVEFDRDETFLGNNLADELNRTITAAGVTVRHELTPLTTITVSAGLDQDRFAFSPLRDSDSTRVGVTVNFDPFALISGSAHVGVRHFRPAASDLPDFSGTTAAVDLSYIAFGATRVNVRFNRDLQYSFEVNQPYYLQTGVAGTITQQIYGPLDAEVRVGRQRLSYVDREAVDVLLPGRKDTVRSYGFGTGYRLGRDLRLGVNADRQKRVSLLELREYDGFRYGVALTYGVR